MNTKADFYLLPEEDLASNSRFICRLIEKAYHNGNSISIYTESEDQAKWLHDALWTFRDISFVPHIIYEEQQNTDSPIKITYSNKPIEPKDIIVNLTPEVLSFYNDYKRVLEIITNEEKAKSAGRKKYKQYQSQGCKLNTHHV